MYKHLWACLALYSDSKKSIYFLELIFNEIRRYLCAKFIICRYVGLEVLTFWLIVQKYQFLYFVPKCLFCNLKPNCVQSIQHVMVRPLLKKVTIAVFPLIIFGHWSIWASDRKIIKNEI